MSLQEFRGYVGARPGAYWYPLAVGMDVDYLQRDSWLLRHVICYTLGYISTSI